MKPTCIAALLAAAIVAGGLYANPTTVRIAPGENWWGAANYFGTSMPFTSDSTQKIDLRKDNYHNQCASFLVSDKGRSIWCARQCLVEIGGGEIRLTPDDGKSPVVVAEGGATLRDAFRSAARAHFPSSGTVPPLLFFSAPQYNTWIELTYHQNEKGILEYARSMLANGCPPGILMIDDTWQFAYGTWEFDPRRFSNPKGMCDELHRMGFKVILWMCPYVSMDSPEYRRVATGRNPDDVRGYPTKGGFFLDPATRQPAACRWWNGVSAFLDFTHPNARAWYKEQLDRLVADFGVDGFKLDGADLTAYTTKGRLSHKPDATTGERNLGYSQFALDYPCSEFRNAWGRQGQPLVVRLHDKPHKWEALGRMVADMIAAGLLGYPFICPDMVGGGEWTTFIPGSPFDPELFVRSAQVHALCPMMQFSASPWRVLDAEKQQIVRDAVALRQRFAPMIVSLAKETARTGEPILRNLEYNFPAQGYAAIKDEFMMGETLLVAPQLAKGATSRQVVIPPGTWKADDGTTIVGPTTVTVSTPLSRLPHFVRQ
jgi:alpha-glucosidase